MPRVIHFEIAATDLQRVAIFYGQVFGWGLNWWNGSQPYILCDTGAGAGISGAVMPRVMPGQTTMNTIDVPSIDEYAARVQQAGGRVVSAKMAIAGIGWLAYCQDVEGNTFGIIQPDPSARG